MFENSTTCINGSNEGLSTSRKVKVTKFSNKYEVIHFLWLYFLEIYFFLFWNNLYTVFLVTSWSRSMLNFITRVIFNTLQ